MPESILSTPTLLTAIIILFIWLLIFTILFIKSERRLSNLTKGITKKDLRTILDTLRQDNLLTSKELAKLKKKLGDTNEEVTTHFQNIGFVRYNPFSDTGGDQSFCLALLDGHHNGVVISSLHSRDQTRIYAKKIEKGKSPGYTLSKEERAVIKQATK